MLGGSVFVALLRNFIGLSGVVFLFLSLDNPRFSFKKATFFYCVFAIFMLVFSTSWYYLSRETYIVWVVPTCFFLSCIFCVLMSQNKLIASFYNLAVVFLATTFYMGCGIYVSTYLFNGSIAIDIIVRFLLLVFLFGFFTKKFNLYFKKSQGCCLKKLNSLAQFH